MSSRYFHAAVKTERGPSNSPRGRSHMTRAETRGLVKAADGLGITSAIGWLFVLAAALAFGGIILSITGLLAALAADGGGPWNHRVAAKLHIMRRDEAILYWSIGIGPWVSAFFAGIAEVWWLCLFCIAWGLAALIALAAFPHDQLPTEDP